MATSKDPSDRDRDRSPASESPSRPASPARTPAADQPRTSRIQGDHPLTEQEAKEARARQAEAQDDLENRNRRPSPPQPMPEELSEGQEVSPLGHKITKIKGSMVYVQRPDSEDTEMWHYSHAERGRAAYLESTGQKPLHAGADWSNIASAADMPVDAGAGTSPLFPGGGPGGAPQPFTPSDKSGEVHGESRHGVSSGAVTGSGPVPGAVPGGVRTSDGGGEGMAGSGSDQPQGHGGHGVGSKAGHESGAGGDNSNPTDGITGGNRKQP